MIRTPPVLLLFCMLFVGAAHAHAQTTDAPAVTPGSLRSYSTIYSVGVEWDVVNDTNHSAAAAVEYRVAGAGVWSQGLPLVRVDYAGSNMLAGSILFLSPATTYEVRLSLWDPDGGAEVRTIVAATRPLPVAPAGRTFHVVPGTGTGDGSWANPFKGVAAAQTVAQPGDTFLLHAGGYGGRIRLDRPGTAGNYIVWKAAGDGEVTMNGIDIAASHIWLEGLTVRNQAYATFSIDAPVDVVVTRCTFLNNHYSIYLQRGGEGWYIADNVIVGDTPAASESFDGEGIELNNTSGHTVAHNTITNTADGISYPLTNVDIFGNDIFDTSDDGIEADNGKANVRMWGNRIHNAVHNAISFQPQAGAPWYIVRNQIVSSKESPFKFRTTDRFVLLHNTIVNWSKMMCCNEHHVAYAYARNNLWVSAQGGQIWWFGQMVADWRADLNYDGFDWGGSTNPFVYGGLAYSTLGSFALASGLETSGRRVFRSTCFETFNFPAASPASVPSQYMTLSSGCNAVDAGALLPGINDNFTGAAPDLGAYERGQPLPRFGPRPVDPTITAPAAPSDLKATSNSTTIALSWRDGSIDEDGFTIERSSDGISFLQIARVDANISTYADPGLRLNRIYYYRVRAFNVGGWSGYSNVASAKVRKK